MNINGKNPYIGPRTFLREEGDLFFGREREARDLLALVVSEQLVLFYAQSGAGKSSLVNTRLIPNLEKKGYEVLPVTRVSGETPPGVEVDNIYIFNLMRNLVQHETNPDSLSHLSLTEFLDKLSLDEVGYFYDNSPLPEMPEGEAYIPWRRALIIDQFEELFSTHPEAWGKREDFFRQLATAMQNDPYLWVVVVMREDYIAALDPFAYLMPGGLRVRYYMQRLGREAALKAVKSPVAEKRPYASNVAEKLVDDLCSIKMQKLDGTPDTQPGQYVEPVQLQVVCYSLWENLPAEGTQITEKDLQDVGDVNQSLGRYYAGRVKTVAETKGVKERLIREWFEKKLISPGGIRTMVLQEPNKRSGRLADHVIRALQSDLVRAESRGGGTFYELTHDRLVEPIIENNKTWFDENLSPLQRQAALWIAQEQNDSWLLNDQALAEVEQWARENQDELTDTEREFLEACRKQQAQLDERRESQQRELEMANQLAAEQALSAQKARRFSMIAVVLVVLAFLASAVAIWGMRSAQTNADAAATAQAQAQANEQEAKDLADTARARELASLATGKADEDLALSMLLSIEAYDITVKNSRAQSAEAQSVLFQNAQRSARLRGYLTSSSHPADQFRFSPDGKFIAAVTKQSEKSSLTLWDVAGSLQSGLQLDDAVSEFFFSPDSKYLIWRNRDGFSMWDVKTKSKVHEDRNVHIGEVSQIVFDPNGKNFASLGENGDITLWDIAVEKTGISFQSSVTAFSSDGTKFAVFDRSGRITVGWINSENQEALTIDQKPDSLTSLAFNQDGSLLAIATKDGNIVIWDLINNQETDITYSVSNFPNVQKMAFLQDGNLVVFNVPTGTSIFDRSTGQPTGDPIVGIPLAFSPDGQSLAVLGNTADVTLYSTDTRKQIGTQVFKGNLAVFNSDGSTIALFNEEDNKITLISSESGQTVGEAFPELPSAAVSMAFNRDGNLLAVGAEDGTISVWEVNIRSLRISDNSQSGPVSSLAFSPDGQQLVAGRRDSTISIWDLNTEDVHNRAAGYAGYITSVGMNPTGEFLYSIAKDEVALLDMNTLNSAGPTLPGQNIQFIADTQVIAVVDFEKSMITLWNSSKQEMIATIPGNFVQPSPKGGILTIMDKDENITLWNTRTGDRLPLNELQQKSIQISPNDKFIYALDISSNILLLEEVSSGSAYDTWNGQRFIAFSPDDKILATSTILGEIELWDPLTRESLLEEPIKAEYVLFSPDAKYMLAYSTSSPSGNTTIWDVSRMETIGPALSRLDNVPFVGPDGWFVMFTSTGTTNVLNMKTGKTLSQPLQGSFAGLSQDGRLLAVNSNSGIVLWDVSQDKAIGTPHLGSFVDMSYTGKFVAARIANNELVLWDTSTGNQIGSQIRGQAGLVGPLVFDKKGDIQAVRSEDGTISLSGSTAGNYLPPQPNAYLPQPQYPLQSSNTLVFSPDERTFAIFSPDGSLTLWDIFARSFPDNTVKDFTDPISTATLNSDASLLAVSSEEDIGLWNAANDSLLGTLEKRHVKEPLNVYLSQSGSAMVSVNQHNSLSLWDVSKGVQVGETIHETFHLFSPDGKILVTYNPSSSNRFTLWDTSTGEPIDDPLYGDALVFSNDGRYIAFRPLGQDSFRILNPVLDGQNLRLQKVGEDIPGFFQRFGLDGSVVISTRVVDSITRYEVWETDAEDRTSVSIPGNIWGISQDGKIALFYTYEYSPSTLTNSYTFYSWDLERSTQIGPPITNINSFTVSPNNLFLATPVDKEHFTIWNLMRGVNSQPIPGTLPSSWHFSLDGRIVVTTDTSGTISLWDMTGKPVGSTIEGSFWGFGGAENGQIITRSYEEGGFLLYNTQSGERTGDAIIPGDSISFGPDGEIFSSYYYGRGGLTLWHSDTATRITQNIEGQFVGLSQDSNLLVTTRTNDGRSEVLIWNARTNLDEPLTAFTYPGTLSLNSGVRLQQNNEVLTAFGNAGTFVWDLTDLGPAVPIQEYTSAVDRMVFSHDGKTLATVGRDGIILWNVASLQAISPTLGGHTGRIASLSFSNDNSSIVYADADGSIFKLDLANADNPSDHVELLERFRNACRLALSPDGSRLAYKSSKKLFIWDVTKEANLAEWEENISCDGKIAFSEDGNTVTYNEGNRIYAYPFGGTDETPKKVELTGVGLLNRVNDLTFVLDDRILAGTGDDGRVFLWDVKSRTLLGLLNQPGRIERVANGKFQVYMPSENRMILMDFTPDMWQESLRKWRLDLCEESREKLNTDRSSPIFLGSESAELQRNLSQIAIRISSNTVDISDW